MLKTMPDMTWAVSVDRWLWMYKFSRAGRVSWKDPFNGQHGTGLWRHENGSLIIRWNGSKSWDDWDLPLWSTSTGTCYLAAGKFDLSAVARDYYLKHGDSLWVGGKPHVIYDDEVRAGGTIAWVCRNPGNIRDGSKFGAYPGKFLHTPKTGNYAIFPTDEDGFKAIVGVLKMYGRVTITQAMYKYAPPNDGHNDPDAYAAILSRAVHKPVTTYLTDLSDDELMKCVVAITKTEFSKEGKRYARDAEDLPTEIRARLPPRISPLTAEEIQDRLRMTSW